MKGLKKALPVLLAAVMLTMLLPVQAFAMQISVEVDVTTGTNTYTLEVEPTDRIEDIKTLIQDRTGIRANDQILSYKGKVLEEGNALQDYSIQRGANIRLITITSRYGREKLGQKLFRGIYGYRRNQEIQFRFFQMFYMGRDLRNDKKRTGITGMVRLKHQCFLGRTNWDYVCAC